ncbi:MAG: DUF2058 family protein [Oligoflexales bacterium]|nr:DUF2058 family protein [Oligoflexales bacterium]
MNLRDQLLKAGLVSKKQAKKAENTARVENRKKTKAMKNIDSPEELESEAIKKYKAEIEERKIKDKELNAQIERERKEREKVYRAKEIIIMRDQRDSWNADIVYRFVVDGDQIHSIVVTESQQQQLAEGTMGIARIITKNDEEYYLLSLDDCRLVNSLKEGLVVCLHPLLQPGEVYEEMFFIS